MATNSTTTTTPSGVTPERTVGQLVVDATHDLSSIVRGEIALAKTEIKADALKAGMGGGLLAAAGLLSLYALGLLLFAAAYALVAAGLPTWLGFLIIGAFLLVVAGVLGLLAKRALSKIQGKPERTIRNAQDTIAVLKPSGSGS